jgi:oxygen-independent coproporphyrinogen-3 oxidase
MEALSSDHSRAAMSNLGIYIQIPFCSSKCTFCNFSSSVERSSIFDLYARMLWREVDGLRRHLPAQCISVDLLSHMVDSIYMGGGTPALLGAERLNLIVEALRDLLHWGENVEFTIETTPGSVSAGLLRSFRELGINRLSIGAQTFDEQELGATGRLHTVNETVDLVSQARKVGFANISLDLIAGLPHQSKESFRHSLEATAKLRPEHVSMYLFEVDDKSRLGREMVHGGDRYHAAFVPTDDFMADAYGIGCAFLASEGYIQYEISNFALPGFGSIHNQKYWRLAPYLGLGAGAHSFDGARRWANQVDVRHYLARLQSEESPIDDVRILTPEELSEEFFFLGLRQVKGVDLEVVRQRWSSEFLKRWEDKIEQLCGQGWVIRSGENVRMVREAYLISNEIFQEFVF